MEQAINAWGEFWERLVDLPSQDRERLYTTMAAEINACSQNLIVKRREVSHA